MNRLQQLLAFLQEDPNDSFLLYSLAQEYVKHGIDEQAIKTFRQLRDTDPSYVGLYYHLAKSLERTGYRSLH